MCSYPSLEIKDSEPLKSAEGVSHSLEQSKQISSCILLLQTILPKTPYPRKHVRECISGLSTRDELVFVLLRLNVSRQAYSGLAPCCLCRAQVVVHGKGKPCAPLSAFANAAAVKWIICLLFPERSCNSFSLLRGSALHCVHSFEEAWSGWAIWQGSKSF